MGIEVEVLARELSQVEATARGKGVPWDQMDADDKEFWKRAAADLASRLDISPRREQNPLSAAEAARRGFNEGRG